MNPALLDHIGLICPACRGRRHADDPPCAIRLAEVHQQSGNQVVQGVLRCACPDCRAIYPIVAGVPIIVRDMIGWWRDQRLHVSAKLQSAGKLEPLFTQLDRQVDRHRENHRALNLYLESHYGNPTPPRELPWLQKLHDRYWQTLTDLIASDAPPTGMSLDLGCAVGRFTAEMGRVSQLAIGIDIQFAFVERAARLQREGRCSVDRPAPTGRQHLETVSAAPLDNLLFMVADALDPPFAADAFDRVAALNLLDNVAYPIVLLGQMDALLKGGGEMLLASPYEWQSSFTEPGEWLVDPDMTSAEVVKAILTDRWRLKLGLNHAIIDEIDPLPWILRRHDRHWAVFLVHLLHSRKMEKREVDG